VQQHAERVDVGPRVDPPRLAVGQRLEVLRRHVRQGAAEHLRRRLVRPAPGRARQVEVQQHRPPVGRDQDVRRLDVAVQHAVLVRVLQGLGQPRADPGDRVAVRQGRQRRLGPRRGLARLGRLARLERRQDLQDLGPGHRRAHPGLVEQSRQRHPAEIRHAQQMQPRGRVDAVREDRHDVRVLEPGQGLRLVAAAARHLQHDGAVGELALGGAEDPRQSAAAQLLMEQEAADRLAGLGQLGRRRLAAGAPQHRARARPDQLVDRQQPPEGRGQLGVAPRVVDRRGPLARLLAQAVLLVQQAHPHRVVEPGLAPQQIGGARPLAGLAAQGQLAPEHRQPGRRRVDPLPPQERTGVHAAAPRPAPLRLEPRGQRLAFAPLRLVPDRAGRRAGRPRLARLHGACPP
jgi:hypothetical protein